tara:strand:+ start:384 stop:1271 length:888 start_codon:yes stop_codon:yes gene_type:complete
MSSSIKSAIWMLIASANFVILNTLVKYLSTDYHLFQIIFFRSLFAVIFLIPFVYKDGIKSLRTHSIKLQLIRSFIAIGGMYLWFYSIANIPLAKATAINFTSPVFGALFAIYILKEKVKKRRVIAIIFSFIGAMIIIRPGLINFDINMITVLIASILMGLAAIFIKKLSMIDHPNSVVLYMPLLITVMSLIPCILNWSSPNYFDFFLFISMGLVAILAHLAITKAFSLSDATYVLIFDYFRLPITAILAFYIFNEVTSLYVWIGGLLIFASSTYIINREKKEGKKETPSLLAKKI